MSYFSPQKHHLISRSVSDLDQIAIDLFSNPSNQQHASQINMTSSHLSHNSSALANTNPHVSVTSSSTGPMATSIAVSSSAGTSSISANPSAQNLANLQNVGTVPNLSHNMPNNVPNVQNVPNAQNLNYSDLNSLSHQLARNANLQQQVQMNQLILNNGGNLDLNNLNVFSAVNTPITPASYSLTNPPNFGASSLNNLNVANNFTTRNHHASNNFLQQAANLSNTSNINSGQSTPITPFGSNCGSEFFSLGSRQASLQASPHPNNHLNSGNLFLNQQQNTTILNFEHQSGNSSSAYTANHFQHANHHSGQNSTGRSYNHSNNVSENSFNGVDLSKQNLMYQKNFKSNSHRKQNLSGQNNSKNSHASGPNPNKNSQPQNKYLAPPNSMKKQNLPVNSWAARLKNQKSSIPNTSSEPVTNAQVQTLGQIQNNQDNEIYDNKKKRGKRKPRGQAYVNLCGFDQGNYNQNGLRELSVLID